MPDEDQTPAASTSAEIEALVAACPASAPPTPPMPQPRPVHRRPTPRFQLNAVGRLLFLYLPYLVAAWLTFGYTAARFRDVPTWSRNDDRRYFVAALCGAGWPLYWAGRGIGWLGQRAEALFTPATPEKLEH